MTAPSPLAGDVSLTTFIIKSEGKEIDATFQVISIDVFYEVNKVPKAQIVLFDGSPADATFPISDLDVFLPGKKVSISVGYQNKETPLFSGVVVKQAIEIDMNSGSKLVVDVIDPAIKMTLERKNALFEKVTDSALIETLIGNSGLAKDVASTKTVHEEIVQYYASDWDLMLTRAEMNGLVVTVDAGKVSVLLPSTTQSPVLSLKYGDTILDLQAEMDAATQFTSSSIKSYTWDPDSQKLVNAGPGAVNVKEQGDVSSATLAKVFNVKNFPQQTGATVEKSSLQDWSTAELLRSQLSKIRGTVRFQGNALVKLGTTIELLGLGGRFNGSPYVSGVRHSVRDGVWLTTAAFGLTSRWFAATAPNIAAPGASGQLPPIEGLQTGVVKQMAKDPGGEFRVLVTLPILQDDSKGVWARLGSFMASNKFGAVFYPEVGDEVIVGFMNQDPRYPIILGSVYSKKNAPMPAPDDKNNKKSILTRAKLQILFDEEAPSIEIKTPGGHSIKLDDKAGSITIADSNSNKATFSKSGITIDSSAAINLTAKTNIAIKAGANLALEAKVNASMKGAQVAHEAQTQYSAKGGLTAELKSSGMLTIQGALVKIN